jgi:NADH:ubiquinone oxidoreductase subunit 2 (subunit N)
VIAIVAMSGLPPLAGFGGKWLLLSAMMEKGWYGPIAHPVPVMSVAVTVCVLLFAVLWLLRRKSGEAADGQRRILGFYAYYKPAFVRLTPALSSSFWDAVAAGSTALAGTTRRIYSGNGQTYTFYVLSYFVVLYAACGFR